MYCSKWFGGLAHLLGLKLILVWRSDDARALSAARRLSFNRVGALAAASSTNSSTSLIGIDRVHGHAVASHERGVAAGTCAVSILADGSFQIGGTQWRWSDLTKSCPTLGNPGSGKTNPASLTPCWMPFYAARPTIRYRSAVSSSIPKETFATRSALARCSGREKRSAHDPSVTWGDSATLESAGQFG